MLHGDFQLVMELWNGNLCHHRYNTYAQAKLITEISLKVKEASQAVYLCSNYSLSW